jgi:hypothetical protein
MNGGPRENQGFLTLSSLILFTECPAVLRYECPSGCCLLTTLIPLCLIFILHAPPRPLPTSATPTARYGFARGCNHVSIRRGTRDKDWRRPLQNKRPDAVVTFKYVIVKYQLHASYGNNYTTHHCGSLSVQVNID